MEVIEKKIVLQTIPFTCDECHVMMYRGERRTSVFVGEPYEKPDGLKSWHSVGIRFLCSKCEPIN